MEKIKSRFMLLTVLAAILVLMAACGGGGEKSQASVMKGIEGKLAKMNGYKVSAEMTMKTGKEDRNYDVDVWYKKGKMDFYRVGLENEDEKGGQVILKNEEGVFVLTPSLKKSFKFQTEWPNNSSQPYLYQSIVQDVLADADAEFTSDESHYVFVTKTNYQNNTNLPYQQVYFDKETLIPTAVKVLDKDKQVLIEVAFTNMEIDPAFDKNDFHRETILEKTKTEETVASVEPKTMAITFPLETLGAELTEKKEIRTENGERVIMTFKGEKNFTLIQEKDEVLPAVATVEMMAGDVVNLGHSVGAMTDRTIEWNYEGANFVLASEDMTIDEMVEVAVSVQGQEIK